MTLGFFSLDPPSHFPWPPQTFLRALWIPGSVGLTISKSLNSSFNFLMLLLALPISPPLLSEHLEVWFLKLGRWAEEVWAFTLEQRFEGAACSTVETPAWQYGRVEWHCCTPTGHLCVFFPLSWGRLLEDLIPKHKTDFWAHPKRRSSPTARPPYVRSYRKREGGQVWAWTSLLSFHWGSRTYGRKQTPTLLMLSKKTGKMEPLDIEVKFSFLNYLIPHKFALPHQYISLFWSHLKLIEMLHE